jgi:hypothetical protein
MKIKPNLALFSNKKLIALNYSRLYQFSKIAGEIKLNCSNASRLKCWVNFLLIPPKLGGKGAEINLRYPTN